ncbi:hypothetical protein BDV27DRAFT_169624 [Aspergillus caelatus]|uniref:Uncharacterized protein n=1 Tax=Aspergillus caelatus TaxID=61420 RepID=A0A5N7AE95_9EURO|nr:uncharacterized protein BDV27DRAFT_169624 [Aspergillus caelatus]KAE8367486.1 hypothetical protein BDV27DRAFT_169624 [Aspergillus caelatus]
MLVAITLKLLSTLCQQTIGRFLPIDVDRFPIFRRQIDDPQDNLQDSPLDTVQCGDPYAVDPSESATDRTLFRARGCTVYGYPSTGGVLIKQADLLDILFLSLPRSYASQRSSSADEEDRFCNLLRRTGATFWPSKQDRLEVLIGMRESTEEEEKVMVYGWPTDGVGVWVLRFKNTDELPEGFGRISFAMNMEEKIQIMREYGATFVEDVTQVEELHDTF